MRTCRNHNKYNAKTKPRADCIDCWLMWIEKNPKATLTAKDVGRILKRIISPIRAIQTRLRYIEQDVIGV